MALKADRVVVDSQIDFFMNEVAQRGGVVCLSTSGSGIAMDQSQQLCSYVANPSGGLPLGILMNDMVNLDLTRTHINWHKDEVQKGGKVTIVSKGTVVTDRIYPGTTPIAGAKAYVAHSGYIAGTDLVNGDNSVVVGVFLSTKDENGFAKVQVNLPNGNA